MARKRKLEHIELLRTVALQLIAERGEWKPAKVGPRTVMVRGFTGGGLSMLYTTPFQNVPRGQFSERDKYVSAQSGERLPNVLPFLLDVWCGKKVLSVQWGQRAEIDVISFRPGPWERALLDLIALKAGRRTLGISP